MTTLQLQSTSFEHRPHSHHGMTTISPSDSPRIQRPASQASAHLPPTQVLQSPAPIHEHFASNLFTSLPYRQYQPNHLSLPSPQQNFIYPNTAPPMAFYPTSNAYDPRSTQMMRTISHAHPLNSANEQTASSRYSSSPHSVGPGIDGPASASYQWQMGAPALAVQDTEERHINPSVFNNNSNYPMSRSTSGASDTVDAQRLLTPHLEYREQLSPAAADLRKVSDSLGYPRYVSDRYTSAPQGYPQPQFWGRDNSGGYQHFDSSRAHQPQQQQHQSQPQEMAVIPENEYERERMEQISGNRKLLEGLGLGGQPRPVRQMSTSDTRSRKVTTPKKRMANYDGLVRSSPRIASQHRSTSYMDLDGMPVSEASDDSYSDDDAYDEDDFRPSKRGRGNKQMRKASYAPRPRKATIELSLWGLLQPYPQIPEMFPLFYYTLNNDLTINQDSVPLIGSIPSTVTPIEKADILKNYFQRGRRVLNQLDCFTGRCDRKYEGVEERWPELEHNTRIAIRDVRRKIVERCENYKYTRRDLLDKHLGRNKWQPIESGMIEWKFGQTIGDPAGDLSNVTLTLPTPPPGMVMQHQQQQLAPDYQSQRPIRPFPARSRVASSAPRSVSIVMAEPGTASHYPSTAASLPYTGHHATVSPAPPMYGEDQVPMTAHMQPLMVGNSHIGPPPFTSYVPTSTGADPRLSVGVHTPLIAGSSPPLQDLDAAGSDIPTASSALTSVGTWSQAHGGGDKRGVKRERSGSAESDGSELA